MGHPTNEITTSSPGYMGQWSHPLLKWHSIAEGYKIPRRCNRTQWTKQCGCHHGNYQDASLVTPHCLVSGYQLFGGTAVSIYSPQFPKMEAASSSETLAPIYATTRRHIPDVRNPEANNEVWGQHVISNGTKKIQTIPSGKLSDCNTDCT
jgi:hypothetical protein